ncbi:MAG: hypothetical protein PQJ58_00430 [Spirochaetales bacterium]|nr:hypothetical protein [Spirochaetales bacterium]
MLWILLFLFGGMVYAPATELVYHQYESSGEAEAELEEFLYMAISVELLEYNLSSSKEKKGSDYALEIAYVHQENSVDLTLELFRPVNDKNPISSAHMTSEVDINFRKAIAATVKDLMDGMDLEVTEPSEKNASIKGILDLEESTIYSPAIAGYMGKNGRIWEAKAALGSQIFIGEIADLMPWGLNGRASLALLWLHRKQVLSLGITTWASRGFNSRDAEGGSLYLSSAGGRFLWAYRLGVSQYLGVYTEGGIAPLFLVNDRKDVLIQSCPYAEAGVEFRMIKMMNSYLDFNLGYKSIFESGIVITSIEPSISLSFKL